MYVAIIYMHIYCNDYDYLLYKLECFITISETVSPT